MSYNNAGDMALVSQSTDGWRSLGDMTAHRQENGGLLLECDDSRVLITPITDDIIRIRFAPDGDFGRDHSWAVVSNNSSARPDWRLEENGESIDLVTNSLRVRITRSPCRIAFHDAEGVYISGSASTPKITFSASAKKAPPSTSAAASSSTGTTTPLSTSPGPTRSTRPTPSPSSSTTAAATASFSTTPTAPSSTSARPRARPTPSAPTAAK